MVHSVLDTYTDDNGVREITFRYDKNNPNDEIILNKIFDVLREQARCDNCVNYQVEGNCCGYNAHNCKIHGNLDWWDHPHHDGDGYKCPDYKRKDAECPTCHGTGRIGTIDWLTKKYDQEANCQRKGKGNS